MWKMRDASLHCADWFITNRIIKREGKILVPVKYLTLFGTIPWGAVCVTPALHAIQYIFSLFWVSVPSRSPPDLLSPAMRLQLFLCLGMECCLITHFLFFFFLEAFQRCHFEADSSHGKYRWSSCSLSLSKCWRQSLWEALTVGRVVLNAVTVSSYRGRQWRIQGESAVHA